MPSQPSNCLNPFAPLSPNPFLTWQAGTFSDQFASRIAEAEPSHVWAERAAALAKVVAPVLACIRQAAKADLTPENVMRLMQLDNLVLLANGRPLDVLEANSVEAVVLPEALACEVRRYLDELPGYDPAALPAAENAARIVHGYAMSTLRQSLY